MMDRESTQDEANIIETTFIKIKGSKFSSYKIEIQKKVTQNDATLRVTELMVKLLFPPFRVTNSKLKNKKIHFESLTRC